VPAKNLNGIAIIDPKYCPVKMSDRYFPPRRRNNLYCICLHYYVLLMLRYQKNLSKRFVLSEDLPIGNAFSVIRAQWRTSDRKAATA
jgi:hypothetical protein